MTDSRLEDSKVELTRPLRLGSPSSSTVYRATAFRGHGSLTSRSSFVVALELDARCTQIAAFNVALLAWKLTGPRSLPLMQNLACRGLSVGVPRETWMQALEEDGPTNLRFYFGQLNDLFSNASTLGILINPNRFLGSHTHKPMEVISPMMQRFGHWPQSATCPSGRPCESPFVLSTCLGWSKPHDLTESKWSRCARIKDESQVNVPTAASTWNQTTEFASGPGICVFSQGYAYSHGGISLQECLIPDMPIEHSEMVQQSKPPLLICSGVPNVFVFISIWRTRHCELKFVRQQVHPPAVWSKNFQPSKATERLHFWSRTKI